MPIVIEADGFLQIRRLSLIANCREACDPALVVFDPGAGLSEIAWGWHPWPLSCHGIGPGSGGRLSMCRSPC